MSKYAKANPLLVIGISGVTCGGKTTTAAKLKNVLPNTSVFTQDDYFLDVEDPRHIWIPELNHINFDIISSLDMDKMYKDILQFIKFNNFKRFNCMEKTINGINGVQYPGNILNIIQHKMGETELNILIVEGFSIFNYKPMKNLFDLKYYFTLDKEDCYERRIQRVYEPPDCPGYFEKCAWPEHLDQLEEVKKTVRDVKYFDGNINDAADRILKDIFTYIQKL